MKTKAEIVDAWIGKDSPDCTQTKRWQIIMLLHMYGAQVREKAARGLEVVGDQHVGNDVCDDFVRILLPKLAAAIRKMKLP